MLGQLITLEGIDGSGKSTAAKHIAARLAELMPERRLVLTAEPTTSAAGKILRTELAKADTGEASAAERMEELFLFMADHASHLAKTIIPSLEDGAIVLSDRYTDSTAAYQGVTLRNILPDPVQWIRSLYKPWNLPPDRTLLFVLDPRLALQRMQSRPGHEKFERFEFLQSVDENFRTLATGEPERFVLIEAGKSPETVADDALSAILALLS
ncbi:MAG TPA: dTMP kinase [Methanothrix sp.]